jgi:hypothetical protein
LDFCQSIDAVIKLQFVSRLAFWTFANPFTSLSWVVVFSAISMSCINTV